jgi:hypothetical protein
MIAALAFCLAQAIDGADARASFDAVSRRVERGDGDESGISDAFYREVLRSELEAKSRLGERFGREKRIRVKGGRPASAYLEDLEAAGLAVRARYVEAFESEDAIELALEGVTPLEALRALCLKTGAEAHAEGPGRAGLSSGALGEGEALAYRNFLVAAGARRRAEVADFGGPPKRGIEVALTLIWDRGVELATLSAPVVLEATDENGKALALAEPGFLEALGEQYRTRSELELGDPWPAGVGLAPTASKKIARLRGYVVAGIPVEASEFRFEKPGAGGPVVREDGQFEARLEGLSCFETRVGGAADAELGLRIRPKSGGPERMRGLPVTAAGLWERGDGPGLRFWGWGRVEKGEAAYRGLAVTRRAELSALVVRVVRKVEPRRLYFDLRDIELPKP